MKKEPLEWEVGKMKNKHIVGIMAAGLAILFILSCMPVQAGTQDSFVVYGTVSIGGTARNDLTVIIENVDTGEQLTTTSATDDFGNDGYYSVNLGNLPSGWSRNDSIKVSFVYGTERSETFSIPEVGTMYEQDVNMPTPASPPRERLTFEGMGVMFLPFIIIFVVVVGAVLYLQKSQTNVYINPSEPKRKTKKKK